MGYMTVIGPCFGCKRTFSYNATWVPSIRYEGQREPICRDCVERVNPLREANGLEPIRVHPDAYEPEEVG